MGLHSLLKKYLTGLTGATVNDDHDLISKFVVAEDLMSRLFKAKSQRGDYIFTGRELYDELTLPARKRLHESEMCTYVLLCDFAPNVPAEKIPTQTKRTERSSVEPYGEEDIGKDKSKVVIVDGGIKVGDKEPFPIDLQRLACTRPVRQALWNYMLQKFEEEINEKKFVHDLPLRLDKDHANSLLFEFNDMGAYIFGERHDALVKAAVPHRHGEADTSIFYWSCITNPLPRILDTVDSDTIALHALLMQKYGTDTGKTIWKCDYNKYIDLNQLIEKSLKALKLDHRTFTILCILGGTDYFDRKLVLHQFGLEAIVAGVQATAPQWKRFGKGKNEVDEMVMQFFIWTMYSKFDTSTSYKKRRNEESAADALMWTLDLNWAEFHQRLVQACPKKYLPPTEEAVATAATSLRWNLQYWERLGSAPAAASSPAHPSQSQTASSS